LINLIHLNAGRISGIDQTGISKLSGITDLNVCDNSKILELDHLTNLTVLHAGGKVGLIKLESPNYLTL
jgi:hypothetical protein